MKRLIDICSICLLIFISTAECNIPRIEEVVDLAKQASLGVAIPAVDQDLNVMFNNFNDACRIKLNEKKLELISSKMNAINEHVYHVNEAYVKFKETLNNQDKDETHSRKVMKLIWNNNARTDHVQKIYEEIIDPSDPVIITVLGHNKNPNSNIVTKSSASYLFGLLYEILVYTEIKSLALQFYFYDTSTENNKDCLQERAKDKAEFRLSNILNNMNRAVDRFTKN